MNFKKHARQIEEFLEEELVRKPLVVVLPDGALAYNNFIIKKNNLEQWVVKRPSGVVLDWFNLKSCALTAVKIYERNNFKLYNELKILDDMYFKNSIDAARYQARYQNTNDYDLRDFFIARYSEATSRAAYAKKQISSRFKTLFL